MTTTGEALNNQEKNDESGHPLKVLYFYFIVSVLTGIFSSLVIIWAPVSFLYEKKRNSLHTISSWWANSLMVLYPWWKISISGEENLPKSNETVIFVANHSDASDIVVIYKVRSQFRWIAKDSLFKIPFMGWGMRLIGYVPVKRNSPSSRLKSFEQSKEHLLAKTPMFFFPEGTRSKDGNLRKFQPGAFKLAVETNCAIVPISIAGASNLFRRSVRAKSTALVHLHIHPRIEVQEKSAEDLMQESKKAIESGLSKHSHLPS